MVATELVHVDLPEVGPVKARVVLEIGDQILIVALEDSRLGVRTGTVENERLTGHHPELAGGVAGGSAEVHGEITHPLRLAHPSGADLELNARAEDR